MSDGEDGAGETRLSADAIDALQAVARRVEVARRLEFGLLQAEASSIALYDAVEDRLVFRVAAGEHGQGVVGLSVPTGEGLVGYVYTTGQALALADVANDARFGRKFAEQSDYIPRAIVAVPLVDDEGTIGVLEVLDKRDLSPFDLRDIELASVFAAQATLSGSVPGRSSSVELA